MSPVNMPDPNQKHFGYSQRATRNGLAVSNFPHPIQFCFSKERMVHIVQNWPRSDLDGRDLTSHSQFSCVFPQNAQFILCKTDPDLIWMGWIWLPASNSVLFFQRTHGSYCAKLTWIWSRWAGSDFPHPIQFFFSKEHMVHIVQNWHGSDLHGTDPTSHIQFSSFFKRWHGSYCAKLTRVWSG